MILHCREYLLSLLQQLELRGRIYTSMKELESSNAIEYGAVIFNSEELQRSTERRRFQFEQKSVRRFKIFDRKINFIISFGSASETHTEEMYETFLRLLAQGITDKENNYIPIEVEKIEWLDEKDSILRSKLLVQMQLSFHAGLYKDKEIIRVKDVDLSPFEE